MVENNRGKGVLGKKLHIHVIYDLGFDCMIYNKYLVFLAFCLDSLSGTLSL